MLILDKRVGSIDLLPYFNSHNVPVSAGELEFGDIAWVGNGEFGDVMCAVERKRTGDCIQSMRDGRFAGHQLGGLTANYDYVWLLWEGIAGVGHNGELTKLNGSGMKPYYLGTKSILYSEVASWLASMTLRGRCRSGEPIREKRTSDPKETVAWVVSLYRNMQKGWSEHKSHRTLYAPAPQVAGGMIRREPDLLHKIVYQIPGLDAGAEAVAAHFRKLAPSLDKQLEAMTNASVKGWAEIMLTVKGGKKQRLGTKKAEKIVELLRRRK